MAEYASFKDALAAFDLKTSKSKDFLHLVGLFDAETTAMPAPGALPFKNGWHDIDRTQAIDMLRRNRPGANRKIDYPTVLYYAAQMKRNEWKPTGQPMIFDTNGVMLDAQHRGWAIVLSNMSIKTYIVMDTPASEQLFAYVDNGRVRRPSDALQTAGFNGQSGKLVAVINHGEAIKQGLYTTTVAAKMAKMAPIEYLRVIEDYPNAVSACKSLDTDWEDLAKRMGKRKNELAYVGMRIIDLFGDDRADEFMDDISSFWAASTQDDLRKTYPLTAVHGLVKVLVADQSATKSFKRHQVIGLLIKAFNAWNANDVVDRHWTLRINEPYPDFDMPAAPVDEAA